MGGGGEGKAGEGKAREEKKAREERKSMNGKARGRQNKEEGGQEGKEQCSTGIILTVVLHSNA